MLILASKSPRRKEILSRAFEEFEIIPSDIKEHSLHLANDEMSRDIARLKAYKVFQTHPNDTIISSDTVVIFNDVIFNKPKDKADAKRMLKALSGNKHVVLTSYTILNDEVEVSKTVKTTVYFNDLSDELINRYIASGSPMDKAGAYGIQDKEFNLVKKIEGSLDNVIGLPLDELLKDFKTYKIKY